MLSGFGMKYWDDFERRAKETINNIDTPNNLRPRRISIHITNKCNFNCSYCNEIHANKIMSLEVFKKIVKEFSEIGGGIIHVTGGEPSTIGNLSDYINYTTVFSNIDFHLNTNLYENIISYSIWKHVKRLKVSLDTYDPIIFDSLTNKFGAYIGGQR